MSFLYNPQDPAPGVYEGVSIDVYHQSAGMSSTGLHKCLSASPAHYKHDKENPPRHDYFDFGNAVHVAVLEPGDLESRVFVVDAPDYRTRAAQDMKARAREMYPAKYVLNETQMDEVDAMRIALEHASFTQGIRPDPFALLRAGDIEKTYVTRDRASGMLRRARPDCVLQEQRMLVDLKTSMTSEPRAFSRKRKDMGYHLSAAFHLDTVCEVLDEDPADWSYLWVVIEKDAPYVTSIFEASADLLDVGRIQYRQAIDLVASCEKTGVWCGYSNQIEPLDPMKWERDQLPRKQA